MGIHDCETAEEELDKVDVSEEEEDYEEEISEDSTTAVPTPPDSPRIIIPNGMKNPKYSDPYAIYSSEGESLETISSYY